MYLSIRSRRSSAGVSRTFYDPVCFVRFISRCLVSLFQRVVVSGVFAKVGSAAAPRSSHTPHGCSLFTSGEARSACLSTGLSLCSLRGGVDLGCCGAPGVFAVWRGAPAPTAAVCGGPAAAPSTALPLPVASSVPCLCSCCVAFQEHCVPLAGRSPRQRLCRFP